MPFEIHNPQTITEIKKMKGSGQYEQKVHHKLNLANENLTDGEISVLGRGLNFIDVLRDPNMLDRDTDMYRSIHEKNAHPLSTWPTKKENETIVLNLHLVGTLCLHLVWI